LPTLPENFMQIRSEVQTDKQRQLHDLAVRGGGNEIKWNEMLIFEILIKNLRKSKGLHQKTDKKIL